jgi:hypothetical protein
LLNVLIYRDFSKMRCSFGLIVYTPKLVSSPVHLTEKLIIEEEIIEGSLLGILFLLNILILNLYKKEDQRQKMMIRKINDEKKSAEEKLDDSFKYIGQVNIQLQQIKSVMTNRYLSRLLQMKLPCFLLS